VIGIWGLRNYTDAYQASRSLTASDISVDEIVLDQKPHVVRFVHRGVNAQYVAFQQSLLVQRDSPEAQHHPGYQAVYSNAVPVGYVMHHDQIGLIFNPLVQSSTADPAAAQLRTEARHQIDFLLWLGYVHLSFSQRTVLVDGEDDYHLLDFMCVQAIGSATPVHASLESTGSIEKRDPAESKDDLQLWYQLQAAILKDVHSELQEPLEDDVNQKAVAAGTEMS